MTPVYDPLGARASRPHKGWHDRGYLPFFDAGALLKSITFRLADSSPRSVYAQENPIKAGLTTRPQDWAFSSASRERGHLARKKASADETSALPGTPGKPDA